MPVVVRVAGVRDTARVRAVYDRFNYRRAVQPEDQVWLAEDGQEVIGIARIAPEQGTFVLRGMRVAEAQQRCGVGTEMLRSIDHWLGARECYCVPYSHLTGFYGQIGFAEIALEAAPAFLRERVAEYRRSALKAILMHRPPASHERHN